MKIIWRSDDEEDDDDDDDISEFFDDDADGDYTPAGRRKPRVILILTSCTDSYMILQDIFTWGVAWEIPLKAEMIG